MTAWPAELAFVGPPTPDDLRAFLGWPEFDAEQEAAAATHILRALAFARSYTRGRGFLSVTVDDNGDPVGWVRAEIALVIISAAARSMTNPTGASRVEVGQYSALPGQADWTLTERLALDTWRRRAA